MSHEIETMAWTNERPWHKLGVEVSNNLSVDEMMIASGTNWNVSKNTLFTEVNGTRIEVEGSTALIRNTDNKILDVVGGDEWFYTQNSEAFEFFREFIERGDMTMETAGSLKGGQIVWILAKVNSSFEAVKDDVVESHLLFTNYHKYGCSRDIRFTPTRVVCNNTLTLALNAKANRIFKASHRVAINDEMIKDTLNISNKYMEDYSEKAIFLASKNYNDETLTDFINNVFPLLNVQKQVSSKISKNAKLTLAAIEHQPGVEFAPGSWWQAFNGVTYLTDHLLGRTDDTRVYNMWYGSSKDLKAKAYNMAIDYANKA